MARIFIEIEPLFRKLVFFQTSGSVKCVSGDKTYERSGGQKSETDWVSRKKKKSLKGPPGFRIFSQGHFFQYFVSLE